MVSSTVRPERSAVLLLFLAACLFASSPALAGTGSTEATLTSTSARALIAEKFQTNFSEGLAGRTGMAFAIQAGERLGGIVSNSLLPMLGRVMPPGVASVAGPLLGQFISTVAAKTGFDLTTNLYRTGLRGKEALPIDMGATVAGSFGATIGEAIFTAAFGPLAGRLLGSWLGWNLATGVLTQFRKGPYRDFTKAVTELDVPRIFLQRVALESSSTAARIVMGLGVMAPLAASPFALPLSLGLEAVLASAASAAALAVYDTALEMRPAANTDQAVSKLSATGTGGGSRELVALHTAMSEAYRRYLGSLGLHGSLDPRTTADYRGYITARDAYDRALSDAIGR